MPGFEEELNDIIGDPVTPEAPPIDPLSPGEPPAPIEEPPAPATPPAGDVPPAGAEPPAAPQDGTPAEPAPVAPEPPAAPTPSEDPRDAQIRQMQETISALQQTIESVAQRATAPAQAAPAEPQQEKIRFLEKEEDLDRALNSVDNFNELLSNVMAKMEAALLAKSEILAQQVAHGVYTQRSAVSEFYSTNQDLAANKAFVGVVANELAAAHPDWDMGQVISNLATEVRNRLRLSGVPLDAASAAPAPPSSPPAFAGGGPARPNSQGAPVGGVAQEIAELIADM